MQTIVVCHRYVAAFVKVKQFATRTPRGKLLDYFRPSRTGAVLRRAVERSGKMAINLWFSSVHIDSHSADKPLKRQSVSIVQRRRRKLLDIGCLVLHSLLTS